MYEERKEETPMRIESFTQVQQIYNTKKAAKIQKTAKSVGTDQLQLSSIGKDIQSVKSALAGVEDIREELTAPIKAGIANGTYQVNAESFADKLLRQYEEIEL
jgi:negative regulator of flagellin synthesis FlgM